MGTVLVPLAEHSPRARISLAPLDLDAVRAVTIRGPKGESQPPVIRLYVADEDAVRAVELAEDDSYPVAARVRKWAEEQDDFKQFSYLTDGGALDYGAVAFVREGAVSKYDFVQPDDAEAYWRVYVGGLPVAALRSNWASAKQGDFADGWNEVLG